MERPGGYLWLECSHHLVLSPKGEVFRLSQGSHWYEWLSLPCLVVFGFLAPTTISFIVRTDGRTADGRTGRAYLRFHIFFDKTRGFFFFFFECL